MKLFKKSDDKLFENLKNDYIGYSKQNQKYHMNSKQK